MNRLFSLSLLFTIILVSGCGKSNPPKDTVDNDFSVIVTNTKDSSIFNVELRKENLKVDKRIGSFAVLIDFILTDSKGHVYRAKDGETEKYAKSIDRSFEVLGEKKCPIKGPVKLIKKGLKPGKYTMQATARIWEVGKDALRGHLYTDRGSVAVPAGNKITVEIK